MYRNLKNLNEFVLWAGVSASLGFFTRLFPSFWFVALMLRIAFNLFCLYNVLNAPKKSTKFTFLFISGANNFGYIGSFWDYLEILIIYKQTGIIQIITVLSCVLVAFFSFQFYVIGVKKNDRQS